MERTLGKARILELYLALAPWGEGVCGAERAAQRHFGKPAHALDPIEAAWLASLLRDPASPADADRVAWVLKGMARGERQRQRWTRALDRLSPAAASAPDAASP
jgi:membrane peptidoglycan carboxypeptidase